MLHALRQMIVARFSPDWPDIDENTAILWEPCSKSHGEVVPGYAQLLLDLGYRVVVLMTPQRISEGLFDRISHPKLVLTQLSQKQIARFVKTPHIHKTAVFLVSTVGKLPHRPNTQFDVTAVFGSNPPKPLLLVEHDAKAKIDAGVWSENMITLRGLDYKGRGSTVVNPHTFGAVKMTPKSSGKTIFLLVGAARSKRRNQNLIYDAAEQLVDAGISEFEIRLIGKKGAEQIPGKLANHVFELGRLDFADMYTEIEQSDFIVTAFQGDNPDHEAYKTVKTTGSFQLCYGFGKPCILHKDFAIGTALTEQNSIFYGTETEVFDALRLAVQMPADAYAQMQSTMLKDAKTLYETSRANMKVLIDG